MPNTLKVNIAWGDCDEAGLVFYPNFFYWMDSAFHALLKSRGINHRTLRDKFGAHGVFIVEIGAQFFAPASYDQPLRVEARVAHWGTKSFKISYVGKRKQQLIFKGLETRVWIVKSDNGKVRAAGIPAAFKKQMQSLSLPVIDGTGSKAAF